MATTCAVGIIGDEHYSMGYEGIVPKEVFVTDKKPQIQQTYVGFKGGLRLIEDIYDVVLSSYN